MKKYNLSPLDKGGLGDFMSSQKFIPYNKALKPHAREMRNNPTPAEIRFWYEILQNKDFYGYLFLRQKPLLNYIVDFYCSDLRLAIELDGESHLDNIEYDERRSEELGNYGILVVRYFNDEVLNGLDEVCEDLLEKVRGRVVELRRD